MHLESFDAPPSDVLEAVTRGLERHNFATAPLHDVKPMAVVARSGDGVILGGAVGRTWGACCELLELWVAEAQRRRGIGSALLRAFEVHGRQRGCTTFYLTTLSYQAPAFYRAHGYQDLARIDGYPDGIVKHLMLRTEPAPAGAGTVEGMTPGGSPA